MKVKLKGLNSAAHYNGTMGEITMWDDKNSRWKAKLEYDGSTKALKNANLEKVDGSAAPAAAAAPA